MDSNVLELAPGRQLDLGALVLLSGSHSSFEEGMCVMEAVAFVAGEPHSDSPQCACPAISAFLRRRNDRSNDEERQELKPFIPRLVGSRGSRELTLRRAYLAANWAIRVVLPMVLDATGIAPDISKLLKEIPPCFDRATFLAARDLCQQARTATATAAAAAADTAATDTAYATATAAAAAADTAATDTAATAAAYAYAYAGRLKALRAEMNRSSLDLLNEMLDLSEEPQRDPSVA